MNNILSSYIFDSTFLSKGKAVLLKAVTEATKVTATSDIKKSWKHVGLCPFDEKKIRDRLTPHLIVDEISPEESIVQKAQRFAFEAITMRRIDIQINSKRLVAEANKVYLGSELVEIKALKPSKKTLITDSTSEISSELSLVNILSILIAIFCNQIFF